MLELPKSILLSLYQSQNLFLSLLFVLGRRHLVNRLARGLSKYVKVGEGNYTLALLLVADVLHAILHLLLFSYVFCLMMFIYLTLRLILLGLHIYFLSENLTVWRVLQ